MTTITYSAGYNYESILRDLISIIVLSGKGTVDDISHITIWLITRSVTELCVGGRFELKTDRLG